MTNAFILFKFIVKSSKSLAANREGSFKFTKLLMSNIINHGESDVQ